MSVVVRSCWQRPRYSSWNVLQSVVIYWLILLHTYMLIKITSLFTKCVPTVVHIETCSHYRVGWLVSQQIDWFCIPALIQYCIHAYIHRGTFTFHICITSTMHKSRASFSFKVSVHSVYFLSLFIQYCMHTYCIQYLCIQYTCVLMPLNKRPLVLLERLGELSCFSLRGSWLQL